MTTEVQNLRADLHARNNELQAAIGTLWQEFCARGPLENDALNGCDLVEASKICSDTFRDVIEERDELRRRLESADRYIKTRRTPAPARVALGVVRAVARKVMSR